MTKVFNSCTFNFEPRTSNFEVHKLARYGVSLLVGRHTWLGFPHDTLVIPTNILDQQSLAIIAQKKITHNKLN